MSIVDEHGEYEDSLLNARDIYRVFISPRTGKAHVECVGLECNLTEIEGVYASVDELPDWVHERVMLLSMTSCEPPTKPIRGLGHRINEFTFWVFYSTEEELKLCTNLLLQP